MRSRKRIGRCLWAVTLAAASGLLPPSTEVASAAPVKTVGYSHCVYGPEWRHEARAFVHILTATMPYQRGCTFRRRVVRYDRFGGVRSDRTKNIRMNFDTPYGNSPSCILNPALGIVSGRVQMEGLRTYPVSRNVWISEFFCVAQGVVKTVLPIGSVPVGVEIPVSGAWKMTRTTWGDATIHTVLQVQSCRWDKTNCSSPETLDHRYKSAQPQAPGGPLVAELCVQGSNGYACRPDILFDGAGPPA